MSHLIAISGKGGVGKTTISAMLIKQLLAAGKKPVLAIDADPNSCLDMALGVTVTTSVGTAREEVRDKTQAGDAGISKTEMLHMKIAESLVESNGFDMISMGRPEGAGCYCYANSVLKTVIQELSNQYPYVVLDNEAGLENLSRRIVADVDVLVLVSDASNAGIRTLERLHALAVEMKLKYQKLILVINRMRDTQTPAAAEEAVLATGADELYCLPYDSEVAEFAEGSRSFLEISDQNVVLGMIGDLVKGL
ncbi:MAG: AAA family ATPase [Coriobacteriia bacterium]|nr:AAA family ATPase [Coriobacteriia bacterium]